MYLLRVTRTEITTLKSAELKNEETLREYVSQLSRQASASSPSAPELATAERAAAAKEAATTAAGAPERAEREAPLAAQQSQPHRSTSADKIDLQSVEYEEEPSPKQVSAAKSTLSKQQSWRETSSSKAVTQLEISEGLHLPIQVPDKLIYISEV